MEIDFERHEHVTAPITLVWEEVGSLEQILTKTPLAQNYEISAGGERATFQVHLAWGPVKWTVDASITLVALDEPHSITIALAGPSLDVEYHATIELTAVGSGDTKLSYQGHLECRHRLASRLRGMLTDMAEEHMYGVINRAKVRSEQRRLAQDRLLS